MGRLALTQSLANLTPNRSGLSLFNSSKYFSLYGLAIIFLPYLVENSLRIDSMSLPSVSGFAAFVDSLLTGSASFGSEDTNPLVTVSFASAFSSTGACVVSLVLFVSVLYTVNSTA